MAEKQKEYKPPLMYLGEPLAFVKLRGSFDQLPPAVQDCLERSEKVIQKVRKASRVDDKRLRTPYTI